MAATSGKMDYALLSQAPSRLNPIGERRKLQRIENLALTKDQNDTLDLTDNDLRRLDNFPYMPRLKTLLLANNRLSKIDSDLSKQLPNLATLVLSNNQIVDLADLDALISLEHLNHLALLDNPVALKRYYRLYVIHRCPSVRILDFRRVREKERNEAAALFSGETGIALLKSLSSAKIAAESSSSAAAASATASAADPAVNTNKTFVPGEKIAGILPAKKAPSRYAAPTPEEAERIRSAIRSAKTLDEIARLEKMLQSGIVPEQPKALSSAK
eukprot:jgi/Hompol1/3218/HPOL_001536-RA